MKLLSDLLYKARIEEIFGSTNVAIESVSADSRKVGKLGIFVAVKGLKSDGHEYITDVIYKGAAAIICEDIPDYLNDKVTYIKVKNSQAALGIIANNFYDQPSEKIKVIGITGTNGKTTTATLLFNLFSSLGHKCGLISTVKNQIIHEIRPSEFTTPDPMQLNALMHEMVNKGCRYCFMEVSSHAVVQHRITGIKFSGGLFTNITHDHLDYHVTFDEYIKAKKGFFDQLGEDSFALVNKDDKNAMVMLQNTRAKKYTYSLQAQADFKTRIIENQFSGLLLSIDGQEVWSKLIGSFNAYNITAVYAAAMLLKQDKIQVLTALSALNPVEGRFQFIRSTNGITGIVDYAHTPDALVNVLNTIADIRTGNEKLITVIGCGGDRDVLKRPLMANIACKKSNQVILTSDNPRSEEPDAIIKEMQKGIEPSDQRKALSITERAEAIKTACTLAKPGDIILVAGKGHEKYQEIKGIKYPFDDLEILDTNLKLFDR